MRPSKFMTVDSIESTILFINIIHNMSVEECGRDTLESEDHEDDAVIVEGGVTAM